MGGGNWIKKSASVARRKESVLTHPNVQGKSYPYAKESRPEPTGWLRNGAPIPRNELTGAMHKQSGV